MEQLNQKNVLLGPTVLRSNYSRKTNVVIAPKGCFVRALAWRNLPENVGRDIIVLPVLIARISSSVQLVLTASMVAWSESFVQMALIAMILEERI